MHSWAVGEACSKHVGMYGFELQRVRSMGLYSGGGSSMPAATSHRTTAGKMCRVFDENVQAGVLWFVDWFALPADVLLRSSQQAVVNATWHYNNQPAAIPLRHLCNACASFAQRHC